MGLRETLRELLRGVRDSVTPTNPLPEPMNTAPTEAEKSGARALAAAAELDQQAAEMPEGSAARANLIRIAEELRAFAAGERAKAALAGELSDPAIRQILKNANIRID